jgi:hypothetical protein
MRTREEQVCLTDEGANVARNVLHMWKLAQPRGH